MWKTSGGSCSFLAHRSLSPPLQGTDVTSAGWIPFTVSFKPPSLFLGLRCASRGSRLLTSLISGLLLQALLACYLPEDLDILVWLLHHLCPQHRLLSFSAPLCTLFAVGPIADPARASVDFPTWGQVHSRGSEACVSASRQGPSRVALPRRDSSLRPGQSGAGTAPCRAFCHGLLLQCPSGWTVVPHGANIWALTLCQAHSDLLLGTISFTAVGSGHPFRLYWKGRGGRGRLTSSTFRVMEFRCLGEERRAACRTSHTDSPDCTRNAKDTVHCKPSRKGMDGCLCTYLISVINHRAHASDWAEP